MAHLLLLLPSMSYRGEAFLEAANKVGVSLTIAGDAPPDFLKQSPDSFLTLDLYSPTTAVPAHPDPGDYRPLVPGLEPREVTHAFGQDSDRGG